MIETKRSDFISTNKYQVFKVWVKNLKKNSYMYMYN